MSDILRLARERGVYFIAEIGQNHQGSLDVAKRMVDSLRGSGVSAIKTAKRDVDVCLTERQKAMPYNNPHSFGATYYEHRKALELSHEEFAELKRHVEDGGFDFISSFTDAPSLRFLLDIDVRYLKVASQRLVDWALLEEVARAGRPVLLSTGMSTLEEVDRAIKVLSGCEIFLLQCTSRYPCDDADLNLRVLQSYRERYGERIAGVGFSGHHTGIAPDLAAYLLGAVIIERHYTLDRAWKGSDHGASLEERGVRLILKYIEQIRDAMGNGEKKVLPCESDAMTKLRADLLEDA